MPYSYIRLQEQANLLTSGVLYSRGYIFLLEMKCLKTWSRSLLVDCQTFHSFQPEHDRMVEDVLKKL